MLMILSGLPSCACVCVRFIKQKSVGTLHNELHKHPSLSKLSFDKSMEMILTPSPVLSITSATIPLWRVHQACRPCSETGHAKPKWLIPSSDIFTILHLLFRGHFCLCWHREPLVWLGLPTYPSTAMGLIPWASCAFACYGLRCWTCSQLSFPWENVT